MRNVTLKLTNKIVILVAFGIFFLLECHPLDEEDARGDELEYNGDGEEDDEEVPERSAEFQSMTKLISIC